MLNHQIRPYPTNYLLKRIIMHPVPNWCKKNPGCRPMIRIFSTETYPKELLYSSYRPEDTESAP